MGKRILSVYKSTDDIAKFVALELKISEEIVKEIASKLISKTITAINKGYIVNHGELGTHYLKKNIRKKRKSMEYDIYSKIIEYPMVYSTVNRKCPPEDDGMFELRSHSNMANKYFNDEENIIHCFYKKHYNERATKSLNNEYWLTGIIIKRIKQSGTFEKDYLSIIRKILNYSENKYDVDIIDDIFDNVIPTGISENYLPYKMLLHKLSPELPITKEEYVVKKPILPEMNISAEQLLEILSQYKNSQICSNSSTRKPKREVKIYQQL